MIAVDLREIKTWGKEPDLLMNRIYTAIGVLLLGTGVGLYAQLAMTGRGTILGSFLCCMASLLFFNLPAVLARRRQKGARKTPSQNRTD